MELSLAGLWQLSPLTDLSIPQDDLTFPNPLSHILPDTLSEQSIAEQEWHLMHDIDVDEAMLAFPAIDLVIAGVDYYAEVRVNGVAVFDCDGTQASYKRDIRSYLQLGRNRFEILFLEQDDDLLLEEEPLESVCPLDQKNHQKQDDRIGVWQAPYLQFIRHVRLEHISTEQIWHHGGGCEFLVNLYYKTYAAGLVSASVKFNGMTYLLPIDVRNNHTSALFQIEAPIYNDSIQSADDYFYQLEVSLDDQTQRFDVGLCEALCVQHYPI